MGEGFKTFSDPAGLEKDWSSASIQSAWNVE